MLRAILCCALCTCSASLMLQPVSPATTFGTHAAMGPRRQPTAKMVSAGGRMAAAPSRAPRPEMGAGSVAILAASFAVPVGLFVLLKELRARRKLIEASEECELGKEEQCAEFEETVAQTPAWKLRPVLSKLMQSNTLADKMGSAPAGFTWGGMF